MGFSLTMITTCILIHAVVTAHRYRTRFLLCTASLVQRSGGGGGGAAQPPQPNCLEPKGPGADFTKGLSPVSDSNLRLLSQIIGIFYLSPWAQP